MKKVLISIAIISLLSCGTLQSPETIDPIPVQKIFETTKSKDELYTLSNSWMVDNFVSAKNVIQYQDKDAGIITGKGINNMNVGGLGKIDVKFTITIEVKKEKARLTLKDMKFADTGDAFSDAILPQWHDVAQEKFEEWARLLFQDYEEYIEETNSDW